MTKTAEDKGSDTQASPSLRDALTHLFHHSETFRTVLLVLDVVVVAVFIALTFVPTEPWVIVVDAVIGTLLLAEFGARLWISRDKRRFLLRVPTILDMIVIATLFLPTLIGNFGFLRIFRALRLIRVLSVVRELKRKGGYFAEHGELISSATNLVIFVFIMSALVYVVQVDENPGINNFIDAIYFTVAALTTTGFGDITLVGEGGYLLSVVIMLIGISLFIKLAQTIFRPQKVHYECPTCGLSRHDPDAIHCKHCGTVVHIETEGAP